MDKILLNYVNNIDDYNDVIFNHVKCLNDRIREKVQEGVLIDYLIDFYDCKLLDTDELRKSIDLEEEFLECYFFYTDMKLGGFKKAAREVLSRYIGCPVNVIVKHINDIEELMTAFANFVVLRVDKLKSLEAYEHSDGFTAYEFEDSRSVREHIEFVRYFVDKLKSYSVSE